MPAVEEEIVHLREKAPQFVALAKEHRDNDRVRKRLMTVAADLYAKAADLEQKPKRGAALAAISYAGPSRRATGFGSPSRLYPPRAHSGDRLSRRRVVILHRVARC